MIEKLGHSKRIQVMRKEWINEGKPKMYLDEVSIPPSGEAKEEGNAEQEPRVDGAEHRDVLASHNASGAEHDPGLRSHEANVLPEVERDTGAYQSIFGGGNVRGVGATRKGNELFLSDDEKEGSPDEDDLDALLAEEAVKSASGTRNVVKAPNGQVDRRVEEDDEFADEMEAMAGMDDTW